jgi:two-component system response regulator PrrA
MPNPAPHSHAEPATIPVTNVVIVDDDPHLLETLEVLLAAEGYAVECYSDPFEALARLRQGRAPDLVLIDCIMPGLTGGELCEALVESGIEVPVVLMTALADPSFAVHPERASVLNKPFMIDDLLMEIEDRIKPRSGPRSAPISARPQARGA